MGVLLQPTDWLHVYAQGQDSREFNGRRPLVPGAAGAEGDDAFDLRQAYIEISNYEKCPWGLKIGRQELSYGDERLVGSFDWSNFTRTFDAAKLMYKGHGFSIDAFSSTPVVITRNQYNQSDFFNGTETQRDLVFSGIYGSIDSLPFGTWDLYSFVLDEAGGNTANFQGLLNTVPPKGSLAERSDFVTLGTRIKGDPKKLRGWEFSGEFAYQAGKVRDLNLSAFAINAGAGYNFLDAAWTPRIFAEYNYASGDDNPASHDLGTFQNLFPTNHKFFGIMDLFSWQNMQNAHLSFSVKPVKSVTASIDYYAYWLANNNDAWYRSNGVVAVRPLNTAAENASNFEGQELDFVVTWNVKKYFQIQGGFAHFFAGDYLANTGAHSDANFGYGMITLNF